MKRLLRFDSDGWYLEEVIVFDNAKPLENEYLAELNEEIAFHKPKLVDGQIVEGKTAAEFADGEMASSLQPTPEELEDAEFEIRLITKLSEWGVL